MKRNILIFTLLIFIINGCTYKNEINKKEIEEYYSIVFKKIKNGKIGYYNTSYPNIKLKDQIPEKIVYGFLMNNEKEIILVIKDRKTSTEETCIFENSVLKEYMSYNMSLLIDEEKINFCNQILKEYSID